jgi:hypothetical protein
MGSWSPIVAEFSCCTCSSVGSRGAYLGMAESLRFPILNVPSTVKCPTRFAESDRSEYAGCRVRDGVKVMCKVGGAAVRCGWCSLQAAIRTDTDDPRYRSCLVQDFGTSKIEMRAKTNEKMVA